MESDGDDEDCVLHRLVSKNYDSDSDSSLEVAKRNKQGIIESDQNEDDSDLNISEDEQEEVAEQSVSDNEDGGESGGEGYFKNPFYDSSSGSESNLSDDEEKVCCFVAFLQINIILICNYFNRWTQIQLLT